MQVLGAVESKVVITGLLLGDGQSIKAPRMSRMYARFLPITVMTSLP